MISSISTARWALGLAFVYQLSAQNPAAVSAFFEGKHVVVKLDMPATQQGVDVYPQRPQTLDLKSYSNRIKKFGASLRNGDSVLVTKVKVKNDNIEFQLGGGGYGTAFDDTDTSVHFTPADKSGREKELQDQLNSETDPDRRRSLQRELDDARSDRERRDQRDRAAAEDGADSKRQQIDVRRQQGGSRFNIHFDSKQNDAPTPEVIMTALGPYVTFSTDSTGPGATTSSIDAPRPDPAGPPPPSPPPAATPARSLKKGLTREQVDALFGPPTKAHASAQNGLQMTSCTYQTKDSTVHAEFVNNVLVQYTLASH